MAMGMLVVPNERRLRKPGKPAKSDPRAIPPAMAAKIQTVR